MPGPGRPFQPGNLASPGRPKGSRHRLSEQFLTDLAEQWGEFGKAALLETARTDPAAYCRIVASLLPKQSEKIENPLHGLNADELESLERHLEELRRAAISRESAEAIVGEGKPS